MEDFDREKTVVASFYDKKTGRFQNVITDKATRAAAINDLVYAEADGGWTARGERQ